MGFLRNGSEPRPTDGPIIYAAPSSAAGFAPARAHLSREASQKLSQAATILSYDAGAIIHDGSDEFPFVLNVVGGVVKVFTPGNGTPRINDFLFRGDLFGLADDRQTCAQALIPAVAYRWHARELERLLRDDADLQLCFLAKMCHELRRQQDYAASLAGMSAVERLVTFLNNIAGRWTCGSAKGDLIDLPMSRSEIANYVGLTLESVSRKFMALQRARVLRFHGRGRVEIIDRPAFDRLLNVH